MARADLIEHVRNAMTRAGYAVSERCDLRPVSFDLVARRDNELVILKVLHNVDALSEAIAAEIKLLSGFLEARPLLVGVRAGTGNLEDGVIYNRHDIPIVTPGTLEDHILGGSPPMVFAAPGGLYVRIDASALRDARADHALSLGAMAQIAGVSRRAIQMYEQGMSASIEAAMRLEEFLRRDLIVPTDPMSAYVPAPYQAPAEPVEEDPLEALLKRMLTGLGYDVRPTRRSPFQAISSQEDASYLTGMGHDTPQLRRRAHVVSSVSRITERPGFFVVERTTKTEIHGMPVVTREELRQLANPDKILDLILKRSKL
jgi:putative transcriptional regulator